MSGCLGNDVFVRSQVTILKGEHGGLFCGSRVKERKLEGRKNPALDSETVCFCSSTLYVLLLSDIITPNIYG